MNYNNSSQSIYKTFIFKPIEYTGDTTSFSACTSIHTNEVVSCSGDSKVQLGAGEIRINNDLLPKVDNTTSVGSKQKRFRAINTYSGTASVWTGEVRVVTPTVELVNPDPNSTNDREITYDSSVLNGDTLSGGTY